MILEVAAGVVLGGIVLWLLAAFAESLLKLAICIAGIIAAILALLLVVWILTEAYHGISIMSDGSAVVHTPADDRAEGLAILIIGATLIFVTWKTIIVGEKIIRELRLTIPLSSRRWWRKYRVVSGHGPLFVLAHAPWLWLARLRQRSYPWSRIQRRTTPDPVKAFSRYIDGRLAQSAALQSPER